MFNATSGDQEARSRRGMKVLPNDPRVPCSDTKERERGPLRMAPPLLPVAESVDAYTHGLRELGLGESDKAPERGEVLAGFEDAGQESLSNPDEIARPKSRSESSGMSVM